MTKKLGQNFKYLENEKSFQGEIESIFHHFEGVFTEANKPFLGGGSPNLMTPIDFANDQNYECRVKATCTH